MMTVGEGEERVGFHAVLAAPGHSPTIPDSMDVYGWLIGSWDLEVLRYWGNDVAARRVEERQVHFGWVLEGRAIQDVWIMPRRSDRTGTRRDDAEHVWHHVSCGTRSSRLGGSPGGIPPADTTRSRSAAALALTSSRSALARMARRRGGPSPRSRRIRSAGSGKRWSPMARRGSWKGSFEPDGER